MPKEQVIFRVHAYVRMTERDIRDGDVLHVLDTGEVIEDYPNDYPFPSRLVLGWRNLGPLHVVAAYDSTGGQVFVITVYEPDPKEWDAEFRRRV